jgi:malonate transporter
MADPFLLLPDFLLIAAGALICRLTPLDRPVWEAAERLVYYLLFPVLLFNSVVRSPLRLGDTVITLAYALKHWPRVDARLHASGVQTAFRFNSFIALALAERLGGQQTLTWMALLIAVCVPVGNVAAVWPLARQGGHSAGRELLRNPLIISTLAGLIANASGVHFPDAITTALQRIGLAALPVALMAVGAGLAIGGLMAGPGLAAALLALRHVVMPLLALTITSVLPLPPGERAVLVLFAAVPTSSTAYVLAARMGGDGGYVAGLVTLSTALGMLSIPLSLAALAAWGR